MFRMFFFVAIVAITSNCKADSNTYTFTLDHPPLLKDLSGRVIALPESEVTENIGQTSWSSTTKDQGSDLLNLANKRVTDMYTIKRYRHWVIVTPPFRFAEARDVDVKTVTGYSVQQKHEVERTTNLSFSGSGKLGGLSLSTSAQDDLKVTDGTTVEWHEELTSETKVKFEADTTYDNWHLLDTLDILHTSIIESFLGDKLVSTTKATHEAFLDNVLSQYEDKVFDPSASILYDVNKRIFETQKEILK